MLNKEMALEWADALESGKYEQGKYYLATIDGDGTVKYCCLGVACEIFADRFNLVKTVADKFIGWGKAHGRPVFRVLCTDSRNELAGPYDPWLHIPEELKQYFNFGSRPPAMDLGEYFNFGSRKSAAELNDQHKLTFAQIAQCIRYTVEIEERGANHG